MEHSYTVESLERMAAGAGLELLAPAPNAFDATNGTLHWEPEVGDPGLQRAYVVNRLRILLASSVYPYLRAV